MFLAWIIPLSFLAPSSTPFTMGLKKKKRRRKGTKSKEDSHSCAPHYRQDKHRLLSGKLSILRSREVRWGNNLQDTNVLAPRLQPGTDLLANSHSAWVPATPPCCSAAAGHVMVLKAQWKCCEGANTTGSPAQNRLLQGQLSQHLSQASASIKDTLDVWKTCCEWTSTDNNKKYFLFKGSWYKSLRGVVHEGINPPHPFYFP